MAFYPKGQTTYGLTEPERDLCLAALRFYQRGKDAGIVPREIENIERNGRKRSAMLDQHDIDSLCHYLNFGER